MKMYLRVALVVFLYSLAPAAATVASEPGTAAGSSADRATIIVLDASGSMRERIKGESKMEIAKRAVRDLIAGLPDEAKLGLVVYSHRSSRDCKDIELLIPPITLDRSAFVAAVDGIKPRGMTPISAALEFTAAALDFRTKPASVILVSDGEETCGGDPCATAARLNKAGVDFVVHAVAFDMSAREARSIACIAKTTGGRFLQARDAASLSDALAVVVAETVTPPPPPQVVETPAVVTPAPEPTPTPPPPVSLKAAPAVLAGSDFAVSWTGPNGTGDFVTVVPVGTADEDDGNLTYTRQGSPLDLTAPDEPGEAELRYIDGRTHAVLGRAPIKITAVDATLEAAPEAVAGSPVPIKWTGPNNQGDYITVVPKGTPDREYAHYENTKKGSPVTLSVPMDPGEAEIRYVSGQRGKVLACRPLKVVAARVTLEAADTAGAESPVEINWTGPNNAGDFITVVAKSVPDGQYSKYGYTREGSPLSVAAPAEPGEAEIRYMSGEGGRVLARHPVTIVAAEASLAASDEAVAESEVEITWTGPGNDRDYITIVPKSAPDEHYEKYAYARQGSPLSVAAPAEPGECEIRYVTGENKVLARRPLKVRAAEVSLAAAGEAVAESLVEITWEGPNNDGDYVTIVPKSASDGTYEKYGYTRQGSPLQVAAPAQPGECEIRYVSGQNKVLARRPIKILPAEVSLSAPEESEAESQVEITWSGPNNLGDFITIVARTAADGKYEKYTYTKQGSPLRVISPVEAGDAEVRYNSGRGKVLARIPIRIVPAPISLESEPRVAAGSTVQVTWTGPNNPGDYITIVAKSASDNVHGNYAYTLGGSPAAVVAPKETGPAEIRYISGASNKVRARARLEIGEP